MRRADVGRPAGEVIGVPYASLFQAAVGRLATDAEPSGPYHTLTSADGEAIDVEVKWSAARWNHREAQLAIVRDVRRRLRTERMLRVATNAMANTSEAVVITDGRFRVVSVNDAFTAITGFSQAEVIGRVLGHPGVRRGERRTMRQIAQALRRHGRWQGEVQNLRKNGEPYPMRMSLASIPEADGTITHYVGIFSDNSAFRDYENRLKHLASHDMLTALPNRAAFEEVVGTAIRRARANGGRLALLFVDLDGFKGVNDTYGHAAGDALLRTLGGRIRRCLRSGDSVARVGGDEFNVLLDDVGSDNDAARVARTLLAEIGEPVDVDGQSIALSASIGISFYPQDASEVDELVTHADMAMYEAKSRGATTSQVFSRPDLRSRCLTAACLLVTGLRHAIELKQLELHYQPHHRPPQRRIVGFEALLRWDHPELGLVSPGRLHPARRGDRHDRADRRLGAAGGLPRRRVQLARARPRRPHTSRSTSRRASSRDPTCRRAWRGVLPRPACRPTALPGDHRERADGRRRTSRPTLRALGELGVRLASTTSAPATRR